MKKTSNVEWVEKWEAKSAQEKKLDAVEMRMCGVRKLGRTKELEGQQNREKYPRKCRKRD